MWCGVIPPLLNREFIHFLFNVSFENFYILIIASRRRIEFEQYRLKEKGGGNAFTTMKINFPFRCAKFTLKRENWRWISGKEEWRIIRKELRCINLKGREGECDERLCGKNIYIGYRTNESLVSFISFNRFFGKQAENNVCELERIRSKKKNTINYFYYSIPESDIIM